MIIFLIIFAIGMRNIIGMVFVMEYSWLEKSLNL